MRLELEADVAIPGIEHYLLQSVVVPTSLYSRKLSVSEQDVQPTVLAVIDA